MAMLSLKVSVLGSQVTKTMQFDPSMIVYDACKMIREKIPEANTGNPSDFGLFLADDDPKKGVWLENGRTLEYYLLRNGDLLEYKQKKRIIKIRMLDGTVKAMQVDDSHTVAQLMITICSKIGITNHEEYSLVYELPDAEREKTLTLKRDKSIAKDQKKLDEMKRKLHTDDDLNWLDHSKTLREQGVDDKETLLLRRKFFFSDQNVDARDPVQLNLLYVQTRDAILKGAHPISQERAVEFAGIQCQIQFGDHVESKHKPGFLDLKEFLPKEYVKVKGLEKKIYQEHKKLAGMSEIEAKVKYTQLARSLKTYGITFFLVKEKVKGKNKLVPRLLGITKEAVVRVDEKTKEIMKTWPLTTVRRWAASPNSFTLDFGDYSDSYYSVQTTEGEQISQLIAGYIDIILKKKKAKDHLGLEGDEESTMYEHSVSPATATIIRHGKAKVAHPNIGSVALPAVLRAGDTGPGQFSTGSMQQAQFSEVSQQAHSGHVPPSGQSAQMHGLGQAQRALLGTITSGLSAVGDAQGELEKRAELPPLGTDPASQQWKENTRDMSKQKVGSQLSAMNAATAQVVTLTSGGADETDYPAVGAAVQTISSNIGEFSKDVKLLAALEEEETDGDKLLEAARRLAGAFTDLLRAAQPGSQEHAEVSFPRQNLLNAASRIGEASHDIMQRVDESELDYSFEDLLLALAKAVANATASLVLKAKGVASKCENQEDQNKVIGTATQCALATSQLVACTKVVAPTIENPACQEQLIEAAKHVAKNVDCVVENAQSVCKDEKMLMDLGAAATEVTKALNDLLNHIKQGTGPAKEVAEVDTILTATDRLFGSMGDTPEMVKQARVLAQATSHLVNALKLEAERHEDSDQQKKLLAAARVLADATAKMVEAAKGCASSPADKNQQQVLRLAAEELRSATNAAATNALKKQIIKRLETAAKHAASAATQLINASGGAGKSNSNQAVQQQLMSQCKVVADDVIPKLVQGLKASMRDPESAAAQLGLIAASQEMLQPGGKLVTAAKAAVPTVGDQAASMSLTNAAKSMATALAELRAATTKAQEACGTLEIDGALDQVHAMSKALEEIKHAAANGSLVPLPGETIESSASKLGGTHKMVGSSMAQLLTAASQGNDNYTGIAARDTANALRVLTTAVRGVAATTDDKNLQQAIIDCALDVMDKSENLIEEAKKAVNNPQNPENQPRLAQVAKAVSQALNNCVNCLPGLREVDQAVRKVTTLSMRLANVENLPATDRSFQEVQITLSNRAVSLNQAAGDIVTASKGSPHQVAASSNRFGKAYEEFIDGGLEMAGATKDQESRTQIVGGLRSVSMTSSKLLMATKSLLADPSAPNAKNQLTQAARAVTDSINHLIDICTTAAPGQKECDNALRQIQSMRPLLDNPSEPISDTSYFECLEGVIMKSKALADAMTGISNSAKQAELDHFCDSVRNFANAVCGLTENSAQAAYLVGIADPTSEPGRPGLVDQSQYARANQAIQMACQSLSDPATSQQQVLNAATIIAKQTSALCNSCRVASSKTSNAVAKRHFVQSAKDVANNTAALVRAIKALDGDFSDENRKKCAEAARPLLQSVDELTTYASSPEFASIPAKISPKGRQAQEPILTADRGLIDGACNMIQAAKQLAVNPRDPPTYQQYSTHSHSVSESIKKLVTSIRESAPGQKECEQAVERINNSMHQLDQAALSAVGQSLRPMEGKTLQGYQDQVINSTKQMLDLVNAIRHAAKAEPENLGHLVSSLASYLEPMAEGSIGCASKTLNSRQQMNILDQSKTAAEAAAQLVMTAKEAGGNPKAVHTHKNVDEAAEGASEMLQELLLTMEDSASAAGYTSAMIDNISKSMALVDERGVLNENLSYVDYQTNMVALARKIARNAHDMNVKSTSNVEGLGALANLLTRDYNQLSQDSKGAIALCPNQEISNRIKIAVQDLGTSCIDLVKDAGNLQVNPTDAFSKRELQEHARKVTERVTNVLAALQAGSRGTQACINAASTVSGIIGDLDTTIMFATAGTLNPEGDESFANHRENILKTAKALVEDTKTLVTGAASNQEQLANAAQSAVMTITRLADCVKMGAASLGSEQPEAQVLLINAVKDVASALGELISATKNASGKAAQDPAMSMLKDSAKVMVTNVTSLLKTVKTVEDEAARGTRALESSIEAIGQELRNYVATDHVEKKMTPEELIRHTKPITIATGKAVAAGNSGKQEDVIVAANMGRKAVFDLLKACKGASVGAETRDVRQRVIDSGRFCSEAYKELLEHVNNVIQHPSPDNKQKLAALSKRVATAVTEIVQAAEILKGTDWVDPHDPTVIAESELLSAANAIEAAAKKLTQLKPRIQPKQVNENLNFEEQILEAAKSIAAATAALVKAASAAQRELIAQGKIGQFSSEQEEDSQWSQGLISAARLVAVAVQSLCEAANAMVQGHGSEEKLISSAKQVASSTAQLLVACKVKADAESPAMRRLQAAGNAVKRATEALVRAAQQVKDGWDQQDGDFMVNDRMVSGIAQMITAQEEILIKEKELEQARRKLENIRRAKYKDRPPGDDSGTEF